MTTISRRDDHHHQQPTPHSASFLTAGRGGRRARVARRCVSFELTAAADAAAAAGDATSAARLRALIAKRVPSAVVAEAGAAAGTAAARTLELTCPTAAAAELAAFFREAQRSVKA